MTAALGSLLLLPNLMIMYPVAAALRSSVDRLVMGTHTTGSRSRDPLRLSKLPDAVVDIAPAPDPSCTTRLAERSQEWVDGIVAACLSSRVDTVISGSDHEIQALAAHADSLQRAGIRLLHPDIGAVRSLSDTLTLSRIASASGLAVPLTWRLTEARPDVEFPIVIKNRHSQGASGVRLIADAQEYDGALAEIAAADDWTAQEYIPGRVEPSVTFWPGRGGAGTMLWHHKHRYLGPGASTAVEIVQPFADPEAVRALAVSAGATGHLGLQFKIDHRDGIAKLIEVNPRLGQNTRLLLGMLDDPALRLLEPFGAESTREPPPVNPGTIGLSPVDDLLSIGVLRRSRRAARRSDNPTPGLHHHLIAIVSTYVGRRVRLDALFRMMFHEPCTVLMIYRRLHAGIRSTPTTFVPWSAFIRFRPIIRVAPRSSER